MKVTHILAVAGNQFGVLDAPDVREAYRELEQRHTRGKIVLVP